ncbi:hypothetical protein DV532_28245 (plasmid) [Pseudomonas sp. Leaf58]|uniref:hypothetical protein n=1 Tax=Pseudomonas sp. Leaf58 TaxID=1736226 RepID=UPI0006F9A5D2|nr:hypothetical protein [Pseudomonas sp. Leaf58]AYG48161.1 hypothetical protein DV532_28245 [Pseudomonas sp. Leaf58]KQN62287.1 hypothetical protein ASF02_08980 [Pseudomonas sp. Leaf58]
MITAFFTQITLNPDGSVAKVQSPPRSPFPQVILAEVIDGRIEAFSCANTSAALVELHVLDAPDAAVARVKRDIGARLLKPEAFVAIHGIEKIRREVSAGALRQYPTGSSSNQAVVALDMVIRGQRAALNHAINAANPEHFFESLEAAWLYYPALKDELAPLYPALGEALFRGAKAQDLMNNQGRWEMRLLGHEAEQQILIEAIVHQMLNGNGGFIRVIIDNALIRTILKHPRMPEVEACTVNQGILALAHEMGVKFHVDPDRTPTAFRKEEHIGSFILEGYDWTLLPNLTHYPSEAGAVGSLAQYMTGQVTPVLSFTPDSPQFWDSSKTSEYDHHKRIVQAIAKVDPEQFTQAFDLLTHNQRLACVAQGYVDRAWIDLEALPQVGLVKILEDDLGL